jgi:hypothetical protein
MTSPAEVLKEARRPDEIPNWARSVWLQPIVLAPLALALGLLAGRCTVPTDHEHPIVVQLVGAVSTDPTSPASEQASAASSLTVAGLLPAKVDDEVNKYGFKRKNIKPERHYVWPDTCKTIPRFGSIYECKSDFEWWEEHGEAWVDWKDEP